MKVKQGKILIVDDEVAVRKLIHQQLSREGYQCREIGDSGGVLDSLQSEPVDLVILDIKMPGKSGIELLPEIKATYPDTAVIMATAITDTSIVIQSMKMGAYDYITKPFNPDEVVLSIDRALEKRTLVLENRDYRHHLEERVTEQARKIRASLIHAITSLAYALEAKDEYTSGHSARVAETAVAIAEDLGISTEYIEKIRLAGLIHDIGKIGVSESILNKQTRLTDEEFQHIKYHSEAGEHILAPLVEDEELLKIVRNHHERYNGTGYPDGLSNDQIPEGSRILAVADSFDAMTSDRSYRKALSAEKAVEEVKRGAGTQFDPRVAEAFSRIISFD